MAGVQSNTDAIASTLQMGQGVRTAGTMRDQSMGSLTQTNNSLDLAIQGQGFFQVRQTNGDIAYTRDGSFQINSQGQIVNAQGLPLEPSITVPSQAVQVSVASDGTVTATMPNQTNAVSLGQIEVGMFINPARLGGRRTKISSPPPSPLAR